MKHEKKKRDILEGVKDFPRVKASDDFVEKVLKKIELYEIEKEAGEIAKIRKGFFENLIKKFRRPYLVPAIGLIILGLLILYLIFSKTNSSIETPEEQKTELSIPESNIVRIPSGEKIPLDSLSFKENLKKKSPVEKSKSFTTKKSKVEIEPKLIEPENKLHEEKEVDKSFTPDKQSTVNSRDTHKDKESAVAQIGDDVKLQTEKEKSIDKINLINKNGLEDLRKKVNSLIRR